MKSYKIEKAENENPVPKSMLFNTKVNCSALPDNYHPYQKEKAPYTIQI
jgi:hypothetical protein